MSKLPKAMGGCDIRICLNLNAPWDRAVFRVYRQLVADRPADTPIGLVLRDLILREAGTSVAEIWQDTHAAEASPARDAARYAALVREAILADALELVDASTPSQTAGQAGARPRVRKTARDGHKAGEVGAIAAPVSKEDGMEAVPSGEPAEQGRAAAQPAMERREMARPASLKAWAVRGLESAQER